MTRRIIQLELVARHRAQFAREAGRLNYRAVGRSARPARASSVRARGRLPDRVRAMRALLATLATLALVAGVAGCGGSDDTPTRTSTATAPTPAPEPE